MAFAPGVVEREYATLRRADAILIEELPPYHDDEGVVVDQVARRSPSPAVRPWE